MSLVESQWLISYMTHDANISVCIFLAVISGNFENLYKLIYFAWIWFLEFYLNVFISSCALLN